MKRIATAVITAIALVSVLTGPAWARPGGAINETYRAAPSQQQAYTLVASASDNIRLIKEYKAAVASGDPDRIKAAWKALKKSETAVAYMKKNAPNLHSHFQNRGHIEAMNKAHSEQAARGKIEKFENLEGEKWNEKLKSGKRPAKSKGVTGDPELADLADPSTRHTVKKQPVKHKDLAKLAKGESKVTRKPDSGKTRVSKSAAETKVTGAKTRAPADTRISKSGAQTKVTSPSPKTRVSKSAAETKVTGAKTRAPADTRISKSGAQTKVTSPSPKTRVSKSAAETKVTGAKTRAPADTRISSTRSKTSVTGKPAKAVTVAEPQLTGQQSGAGKTVEMPPGSPGMRKQWKKDFMTEYKAAGGKGEPKFRVTERAMGADPKVAARQGVAGRTVEMPPGSPGMRKQWKKDFMTEYKAAGGKGEPKFRVTERAVGANPKAAARQGVAGRTVEMPPGSPGMRKQWKKDFMTEYKAAGGKGEPKFKVTERAVGADPKVAARQGVGSGGKAVTESAATAKTTKIAEGAPAAKTTKVTEGTSTAKTTKIERGATVSGAEPTTTVMEPAGSATTPKPKSPSLVEGKGLSSSTHVKPKMTTGQKVKSGLGTAANVVAAGGMVSQAMQKEREEAAREGRDVQVGGVARNLAGGAGYDVGKRAIDSEVEKEIEKAQTTGAAPDEAAAKMRAAGNLARGVVEGPSHMGATIGEEEARHEIERAQAAGEAPSKTRAMANVGARVVGEMTGGSAILDNVMYDSEADRRAAQTERDLHGKAKEKMDEGLDEIARLERQRRELAKNPDQDDPWVIQRKKEVEEQYTKKREELQRINESTAGKTGEDDPEMTAIRSAVNLLPESTGEAAGGDGTEGGSGEEPTVVASLPPEERGAVTADELLRDLEKDIAKAAGFDESGEEGESAAPEDRSGGGAEAEQMIWDIMNGLPATEGGGQPAGGDIDPDALRNAETKTAQAAGDAGGGMDYGAAEGVHVTGDVLSGHDEGVIYEPTGSDITTAERATASGARHQGEMGDIVTQGMETERNIATAQEQHQTAEEAAAAEREESAIMADAVAGGLTGGVAAGVGVFGEAVGGAMGREASESMGIAPEAREGHTHGPGGTDTGGGDDLAGCKDIGYMNIEFQGKVVKQAVCNDPKPETGTTTTSPVPTGGYTAAQKECMKWTQEVYRLQILVKQSRNAEKSPYFPAYASAAQKMKAACDPAKIKVPAKPTTTTRAAPKPAVKSPPRNTGPAPKPGRFTIGSSKPKPKPKPAPKPKPRNLAAECQKYKATAEVQLKRGSRSGYNNSMKAYNRCMSGAKMY